MSSLLNEKEVLETNGLSSNHIRCYIFGNRTLLSLIRHPREQGAVSKNTMILRDESGKYAWQTSLDYRGTAYIEPPIEDRVRPEPQKPASDHEVDEGLLNTLQTFLSDGEKRLQQRIAGYCDRTVGSEDKLQKAKQYGYVVRGAR